MVALADIAYGVANGLVWGLIVSLIAVGLNLVFGLIEIINIAHGDFYMLGAVISWYIIAHGGNFVLALAVAPLAVAALLLMGDLLLFIELLGLIPNNLRALLP